MKILNYVQLIDSELFTKKHKNNQKIRKSSGTVRFENFLKFDSFTVFKYSDFGRTLTAPYRTKLKLFIKNSLGTFDVPYYRTFIKNLELFLKFKIFLK